MLIIFLMILLAMINWESCRLFLPFVVDYNFVVHLIWELVIHYFVDLYYICVQLRRLNCELLPRWFMFSMSIFF